MGDRMRGKHGNGRAACPLAGGESKAAVLLDYASHMLAPESAVALERHIAECAACREFVARQSAAWDVLDAFDAEPVSTGFDDRLYARMEQEKPRGWLGSLWARVTAFDRPVWKPLLPAAAALTLAAGLWLIPESRQDVPESPSVSTRAETIDAEQLESTLEDLEMLRLLGTAEAGDSQEI